MRRATREQQAELEFASHMRADLPVAALRRMAREATARNEARGVTGRMRLEDGRLHQIIEGPCDTILLLAATILSDWRHESIDVRSFRLIEARRFDDWRVRGIDASQAFCALRVSASADLPDPRVEAEAGGRAAWIASLADAADRRA